MNRSRLPLVCVLCLAGAALGVALQDTTALALAAAGLIFVIITLILLWIGGNEP